MAGRLNALSIKAKLILGFGIVALLLLVSGGTGYRSVNSLGEALSFTSGPAWETVEGAMEGTIGLEVEMLGVENLLAGQPQHKALEKIEAGDKQFLQGLEMLSATGLVDARQLQSVQALREAHDKALHQLVEDYQAYVAAREALDEDFHRFQAIMSEVKALGDSEVDDVARSPDLPVTWDGGLERKWTAADNAKVASIALLTRQYHLDRLLRGIEPEVSMQGLETSLQTLQAAVDVLVKHPLYRFSQLPNAAPQANSAAAALGEQLDKHQTDFAGVQAAYFSYTGSHETYMQAAEKLITRFHELQQAGDAKVEGLVDSNLASVGTASSLVIVVTLLGLVLSVLLAWWVVRNIRRQVDVALGHADAIAHGDLDNEIVSVTNDEIGQLIDALGTMQANLKASIEKDRRAAAESLRIKRALDSSTTATTVSDSDNCVIYMNAAAQQLFSEMQPAWQREFSDFDVDALIGRRLSEFLPSGEFRDTYTQQLREPLELHGELAQRKVALNISPVHDDQGNYQGRVTQWLDMTEQLAEQARQQQRLEQERQVAAENMRIREALDQVTANVMLADADGQIIYLNKAAQSLFDDAQEDLRKDLPAFDAARLVGTNIDTFHKDPAHQRALLEKLADTFVTETEVGGRTMRIVANPVSDADGTRLGTAVEWADRTQEVAVEREIDALINAASAGDLQQRIPLEGKSGFLRELSGGFNTLLDRLSSVFGDIAQVMGKVANGDLTHSITADYAGVFGQVKTDINSMSQNIENIVSRLHSVAGQVSASAGEIATGNNNLSSRTEQQASSLEETASSMEELTSTVRNNADNAQTANQVAASARSAAEQGGEVVQRAVQAMQQINQASERISEIIGVIDEIAFQTNLLALNASVEAARAGEQGRGFAVVATEVRNLASRSADAAKEIKTLIQDSGDKVRVGSELVNNTGEALEEIVVNVKKVGDIIAEIDAASREQAAGIDQVNQAVNQLDEMTQQNAALAEEISAASVNMTDNANELVSAITFFRTRG